MTDSDKNNPDATASDDPGDSAEEPKIIVDSDWKEQVAKEKASLSQESDEHDSDTSETDAAASESTDDFVPKSAGEDADEIPPPPPATFEILISMMFTQAMSMLGQIPDPTGAPSVVNKPYAKHTIDTLEMLGEKTKGNLSDDEANMLSEALHALRMAYVNTKS